MEKFKMKKKVAFICVHNSCRAQIAEALGMIYGEGIFESYSAGTETKPQINQDAVKVIKQLYRSFLLSFLMFMLTGRTYRSIAFEYL